MTKRKTEKVSIDATLDGYRTCPVCKKYIVRIGEKCPRCGDVVVELKEKKE